MNSLAARLQHRPLLHALVHTGKRDVPWLVAARNTAAIVLPLAVGQASGHLGIGLAVSIGALNTVFADQPGPYRLRVQHMLLTAVVAGIAALAGQTLGYWPAAMVLVVAAWGFVAGLMVAVSPHATRVGLTSMILLVVLAADPVPPRQALAISGLIFAGGLLQLLFAIAAWPLQRYRPERLALADALRNLANAARAPVDHGNAVALPPSLNDLQTFLFGEGRAHGRAAEAFRVLAELAERIRSELFALADLQSSCGSPATRDDLQQVRTSAAAVLDEIASAQENAAAPRSDETLAAFETAAGALGPDDTTAPSNWIRSIARARAAALGGQLRAAVRNADTAGSRGEIRAQEAELRLPLALQPANALETLRANLRMSSSAFRHALRCGACLAIAVALSHALPLSRGYWLPMTVAIVLRADFGATWRVGLLRTLGTLAGLFVITALLSFTDGTANFWLALALMAVLTFGFRELATVHYGLSVLCITGLVVILLSFYGVPAKEAMVARATETVLGSALALVAYFAWPTWERGREREVLAQVLESYRDYLIAVLQGDMRACRETRSGARAARSAAQASLDRLRAEPPSRANLPRAEALVSQANRCVRATMVLEAARGDIAGNQMPTGVAAFANACEQALTAAADAVCNQHPPQGTFLLRAAQRTLATSLHTEHGNLATALDAALLDASDRIVDAIDSVLHILAQPREPTP